MTKQLTLYTAKVSFRLFNAILYLRLTSSQVCPYAQRVSPIATLIHHQNTELSALQVEIALAEAKAPFTRYEINLADKPTWYAPQVNPASKVIETIDSCLSLSVH